MRKIYSRTVFEFNPNTDAFEVNENESQFHWVADDAPTAMMKGGGGGRSGRDTVQIQTQKTDPWGPQQPYLKQGFDLAQEAFINHPSPEATFSPETLDAQQRMLERGRAGSPLMGQNRSFLEGTLKGDYLYGGEGFNKALDAATNYITPRVDSTFASRGRSGSGLAAEAKTSAIADAFAKQYGEERANQMRASTMAPAVAASDYADIGAIGSVGAARDAQTEFNQNARRNAVLQYLNAIQGNMGSNVTTSGPAPGSQGLSGWQRYLAGAGGGAAQGYAVGGPWGAAAGAGLGLLGAYQ